MKKKRPGSRQGREGRQRGRPRRGWPPRSASRSFAAGSPASVPRRPGGGPGRARGESGAAGSRRPAPPPPRAAPRRAPSSRHVPLPRWAQTSPPPTAAARSEKGVPRAGRLPPPRPRQFPLVKQFISGKRNTKNTQQSIKSINKTHHAQGVLEGEGAPVIVLHVRRGHGHARSSPGLALEPPAGRGAISSANCIFYFNKTNRILRKPDTISDGYGDGTTTYLQVLMG